MAEIFFLPGVERRDLTCGPTEASRVLEAAIEAGVTDVVIVGRGRDGELYVAGSCPDVDRSIGFLMRAVSLLSESRIENDVIIDTESDPA